MEELLPREKCRVLIIGATGYIGRHIAEASLRLGYPTFLLFRANVAHDVGKSAMLIGFKRKGARLVEGSLEDKESLTGALKQVDAVICAVAERNLYQQCNLIQAIQDAGNIKRFIPSEFGMDPGKMDHAIPPGNSVFKEKMKIREAIEEAGIPHTYVSANCFAGYFLPGIAQFNTFMPPRDKVVLYGSGHSKVIWVDEDDVGTYVLNCVNDRRTLNKTVYIRPPKNILSQREVVEIWEKKIGKTLEKSNMSEEEILNMANDEKQTLAFREAVSHFYQIFYQEDLIFDIGPNGRDTAELYPQIEYTTVEEYLEWYR